MDEEQIKIIRQKFQEIDDTLKRVFKAMNWLSLICVSLNELAKENHSEEEMKESLVNASKKVAEMNILMKKAQEK